MAGELLLKVGTVGPDPLYQDGDIVCAFNKKRINNVHAQHICNVENFGFNIFGLRPPNTLAQTYCEKVYQFKFVRINANSIKKINLDTLREEIFTNIPNKNNEYINVKTYINYQKKCKNHKIFGKPNNEFWYSGVRIPTESVITKIWNDIEANTLYRKVNFENWPFTKNELRHFLAVRVNDFDDLESRNLILSETDVVDGKVEVIKKRKNFVNWKLLSLPVSNSDVQNVEKEIDIRKSTLFDKNVIINAKLKESRI